MAPADRTRVDGPSVAESGARCSEPPWPQRRPLPRLGLQRRFSLILGLALLVCLAVFGALSLQAVDAAYRRELGERLLLAKMAATQIDHAVSNVHRVLRTAAAHVSSEEESTRERLLALRDQFDIPVRRLTVLSEDGRVLWSEPEDAGIVGKDLLDDPDIARVFQTGQPVISGLRVDTGDGPEILLTVPVVAPGGRVSGAVSGAFALGDSSLLEAFDALQLGQTGKVQLVDDRGTVLDSREHYGLLALTDRSRFITLVQNHQPYVGVCHECHVGNQGLSQRQDVVAFAPLATAPFGVILRQSADETLAAVQDLRLKLIAFGGLLLIAGLLLAQLTIRAIVKPVAALIGSAERIADGDLNSRVPRVGESEIAVLADALDQMRHRLRLSREAAAQWNERLESNVLQRTKELSALLRSANSLAATLDVDTLLRSLVATTMEALAGASSATVWLLDANAQNLSIRAQTGGLALLPDAAVAGRLAGTLLDSDVTLLCHTAEEIARFATDRERTALGEHQPSVVQSCVGAVMATAGKRLGAILLVSLQPNAFGESDARLLRAMADQAAVSVENARLYAEVRRHQAARGELLARLFGAQEEERRRIARELHDETGQALTAVVMNLVRLRKLPAPARAAALDDAEQIVADTLREIHRLVYDLRPTMLDDLGLVPALEWFLESVAKKSALQINLEVAGLEERLPAPVETALFRIVQEATTNIIRHAQASNALVRLVRTDGVVLAAIEDDGKGFAADEPAVRGTGLLGMQERVALLQGVFGVVSRPELGTKVSITIPLHVAEVN